MNQLKDKERDCFHRQNVTLLADRIRMYKPVLIIVIMFKIKEYVKDAIILAGLGALEYYAIPFAGNGNQNRYVSELSEILRKLLKENIIL